MVRCGDGCVGMGVKVLRRTGDGEMWGLMCWSGHWWWYGCESVTGEGRW